MSKPDNVRGLGSDYSLVMVKSTSWPKSKVNKESTEIMRERREGSQQQVLSMVAIKIAALQHF